MSADIMSFSQTVSHYLIPFNRLYYLWEKEQRGEVVYNVDPKSKFWIRVNSPDKYTLWETWKFKSYDDDEYPIQPADTIIDIGANIGDFSVRAAQRAFKGKILAYEPDKNNFALLKKNKKLNQCNNIFCYRRAVSDKRTTKILYTQVEQNNATHSLFPDKYAREVPVVSTTLDEIVEKHALKSVELVKIDAEGAEYPILFNTSKKTLNKLQRIFFEYHDYIDPKFKIKELTGYLESHGFRIKMSGSPFNLKYHLFNFGFVKAYRI